MSQKPPISQRNKLEENDIKKELLKGSYTTPKRIQEIISMIIFIFMLSYSLFKIYSTITYSRIPYFIIGNVIAMIISDFASGFVHWAADTWGTLDTPLVGRSFVRSFREHHIDPSAMTRHDVVETNADNCLLTLPILYNMCKMIVIEDYDFLMLTFSTVLCVWVCMTNQIHKWAHTYPSPPPLIVFSQKIGLILNRQHHSVHHKPPFDSNYCITNGWCNGFLNFIGFWRVVENILSPMLKQIPREDDYKWTGIIDECPDSVKKYILEKNKST